MIDFLGPREPATVPVSPRPDLAALNRRPGRLARHLRRPKGRPARPSDRRRGRRVGERSGRKNRRGAVNLRPPPRPLRASLAQRPPPPAPAWRTAGRRTTPRPVPRAPRLVCAWSGLAESATDESATRHPSRGLRQLRRRRGPAPRLEGAPALRPRCHARALRRRQPRARLSSRPRGALSRRQGVRGRAALLVCKKASSGTFPTDDSRSAFPRAAPMEKRP